MYVCGADVVVQEVFAEFLGHPLRECGHEYAFVAFDALLYLFHQVVDLVV